MRVFVFDLVSYGEPLDHLKQNGELPWPLPKPYFRSEVAAKTYAEHLQAWQLLDELGYDGVGFNEHHTSPYGLMNSPNLMAAAAIQRTRRLRLLIYGNLLPLHEPLRLAEELAMLDCMSEGRVICGIARGIPREYKVHNIPEGQSRARFEEAWEIIQGLWTQDVFSYHGQFWSYHDAAIWPRPYQDPHPPVWMPVTSSKESIEWAASHNVPITPGQVRFPRAVREDIVRYYFQRLRASGFVPTPEHLILQADVYLADSKAQALEESAQHALYYYQTLLSHGNLTDDTVKTQLQYMTQQSHAYMRPENQAIVAGARQSFRKMTEADFYQRAQQMPWGPADEVIERIAAEADHFGANTVLVTFNRGAMPGEQFQSQIHRFAREVLPVLQAHTVSGMPFAGA